VAVVYTTRGNYVTRARVETEPKFIGQFIKCQPKPANYCCCVVTAFLGFARSVDIEEDGAELLPSFSFSFLIRIAIILLTKERKMQEGWQMALLSPIKLAH